MGGGARNGTDSYVLKERKKERIFISQPQHDRYYMIYSEHSKQLLASERKKYIVLFTDKTGLIGTARHWPRRTQDPKGPISLALGNWRWGGGYGGGEGWGLGMKGRGGGIFFTADLC